MTSLTDVEVQLKSCFKLRELDVDLCDRNWLEESHSYMKDWISELNSSNKLWISDYSSFASSEEIEPDEWTKELKTSNEEWETESETELNVHVRDWISEFGDWETTSDTRVKVPILHGFKDNNRDDTARTITCSICLEEFDKVITFGATESCGHKFCLLCLKRWSDLNHTCPLDRTPFKHIIVRYCGLITNILDLPPLLSSSP